MIDAPAAGEASGNQEQRQRSGGNQDQSSQFFNNLKDKVGTIAGNPMTRDEALKILIPSESHRNLFCSVRNPISMDTRGTNTHVIYKNNSGADERLYLKDVAISYDDPDAGK